MAVEVDGSEQLVFVQRISGIDFTRAADLAWRILTIEKNGQVHESQFSYTERANVPLRVDFINRTNTSPFALGNKSNILQGRPSLIFPILYPFATGSLGLILTVTGTLLTILGLRKSRSA